MKIQSYALGAQTNRIKAEQSTFDDGTVYGWLEGDVLTPNGIVEAYAADGSATVMLVTGGRRYEGWQEGKWTRRTLAALARRFAAQVATEREGGAA